MVAMTTRMTPREVDEALLGLAHRLSEIGIRTQDVFDDTGDAYLAAQVLTEEFDQIELNLGPGSVFLGVPDQPLKGIRLIWGKGSTAHCPLALSVRSCHGVRRKDVSFEWPGIRYLATLLSPT